MCIKRDLLPKSWTQPETRVSLTFENFVEHCSAAGFEFVHRPKAETNADYKQIIPYIVLQTRNLKQTAIYNRQGSEQRLHDLWSLGIGGHINPVDQKTQNEPFEKILLSGMERELNEELEKRSQNDQAHFLGVISEDMTDVGRVHLGAVFRILTDAPEQFLPGPELFEFSWKKTEQLDQLNLELWSRLALKLL